MKNRVRSKSWLCFQAQAIDDPIDSDFKNRSVDPVYIAVKHDETAMIRKISPDMNLSKFSSERKIGCSGRSRYLSRIVKAVFFETALRKSKKVQQDPYQSLRSLSSKRSDNLNTNDSSKNFATVPISYSSSSSSILSSSTSLSNLTSLDKKKASRSNSLELKQIVNNLFEISKPKEMTRNRDSSSSANGLYLLLISLMVLIFWGRVCAIVCTSTWIYLGPRRRKSEDEEVMVIKPEGEEEKMESKQYKKRVIMEGLLERSNTRF